MSKTTTNFPSQTATHTVSVHDKEVHQKLPVTIIKKKVNIPPKQIKDKRKRERKQHSIGQRKRHMISIKPLQATNTLQAHMAVAHFLVISFPLLGHINPSVEFARRLARAGTRVTMINTVSGHRRIIESTPVEGLSYTTFSDGFDDGFNFHLKKDGSAKVTVETPKDAPDYLALFSQAGARKVRELVGTFRDEGSHVTCIVYSMSVTWAADVAREMEIPSVALWIQPATVLAVYYHYFHGYDHLINKVESGSGFHVELPKLPLLASEDLPSFLLPSDPNSDIRLAFQQQFNTFDEEAKESKCKPRVLVNSFDELEREALGSVDQLDLIPIGPLISSTAKKTSSGSDYMEWLDSRPVSSVVYVSFGSVISPCKRQMEEILTGLLQTRRPFLWVIRGSDTGEIRNRVGESGDGLVVPWCSQEEVLAHPSTGCFVTHCGWNSTSESLAMGVPMVCFPQWTDQMTSAKLVEDVWKAGVRVRVNEDSVLEGGELKRCLEEVMGGEEIRKNARKLRDLAREAVEEGGSSDCNLRAFVEEMQGGCCG